MSGRSLRKRKTSNTKKEGQKYVKQPFQFRRDSYWTDREVLCLTLGLQRFGFSETKKIAELIKTKDENAVKRYLTAEVGKVRYEIAKQKLLPIRGSGSWYHPTKEEIKDWPNIRKWRRIMYNQLLPCVRSHDYSKIIMEDLLKSFYEEAEAPTDPQVANFKAIYKYLLDCFSGRVPAELPPIESGVVLMLMGTITEMQRELDFSEERNFLKTFKKARSFAPIKIKSEFRDKAKKRSEMLGNTLKSKLNANGKLDSLDTPSTSCPPVNESESVPSTSKQSKESNRIKGVSGLFNIKTEPIESDEQSSNTELKDVQSVPVKSEVKSEVPEIASEVVVSTAMEVEEEISEEEDNSTEIEEDDKNTIKIPEEIYLNLSKHRKVVQSFNPLNVPMWNLVTEQGYVQNRCEMGMRYRLKPSGSKIEK